MSMMNMNPTTGISIQSTAGAVPVKNDKGELSMQKVKVHRYVSGKRPDYAPMSSSEEESDEEDFIEQKRRYHIGRPMSPSEPMDQDVADGDLEVDDPRLRRLKTRRVEERKDDSEEEGRLERHSHMTWHRDYFDKFEEVSDGSSVRLGHNHKLFVKGKGDVMIRKLLNGQWYDSVIRDILFVQDLKKNLMHIHAPEIIDTGASDEEQEQRRGKAETSEEEEEEDELSDEEIERRRQSIRQKLLNKKDEPCAVHGMSVSPRFSDGCTSLVCLVVGRAWNVCVTSVLGLMFVVGVPCSVPCVERLFHLGSRVDVCHWSALECAVCLSVGGVSFFSQGLEDPRRDWVPICAVHGMSVSPRFSDGCTSLVCLVVGRAWNVCVTSVLGLMFVVGVPCSVPCVERLFHLGSRVDVCHWSALECAVCLSVGGVSFFSQGLEDPRRDWVPIEVEVLDKEDENRSAEESDTETSEYEEYSDSEEETGPRLKPVFVRKKDRVTVMEREREAVKQKQAELEAKKMAEERRKYTIKMVEDEIRKETTVKGDEPSLNDVNTDDENDEVEYEAWKLRELKRIKRDREEREQVERERLETERLRNMTEEERRQELRNNPRQVTNKAMKGKYKFLQKYYHRGAFFMDRDDDMYKRDFSAATLEDHFDKTILPKVMQVKNFGRSGRTKYTHLVDQDTTQFDSPWISETAQNLKFHNNQAAGMKQVFDKPTVNKNRNK
uniref:Microfibrillar-associated protein 1 n=2 Tax=Timema TaxID=61471 RepID=A0A7R8VGB6_TIMDO|nr:unnamed protein product [Timema douglasi]